MFFISAPIILVIMMMKRPQLTPGVEHKVEVME
jgi:hypothetical protein